MEDFLEMYSFTDANPQIVLDDFLPDSFCDIPYIGNVPYMDLESAISPSEFPKPQSTIFDLMPHEESYEASWDNFPQEEASAIGDGPEPELVELNDDTTQQTDPESAHRNENVRLYGWTPEDNQHVHDVLRDVLGDKYFLYLGNQTLSPCEGDDKINWEHIKDVYNKRYNQNRTRIQIYSHFRYNFKDIKTPSYLKAEEQVLLALDEIGVPVSMMPPFLKNPRCAELLANKLLRMKRDKKDVALPGSKEAAFRKRIQDTVIKNKGLEALQSNKFPSKIISSVRYLVTTNPHLKKKYNAMKPAGRPTKKTKMVPVTQQLKTLFKPFIYINNRRKRKTSYPGDGRRYGMNLFALNRLLGSPYDLKKMPSALDDAIKLGVDKSDQMQYAVLRDLMLTHAGKLSEAPVANWSDVHVEPEASSKDGLNYHTHSDGPPAVSILPPTLCTLTGLRGLLCYRETLAATIDEDGDEDLKSQEPIGDKESDEKLERFMTSMFLKPWRLCELATEPLDNSDGDSDSDEDVCFPGRLPSREQDEVADFLFGGAVAEEAHASEESLPELDSLLQGVQPMDWNASTETIHEISHALESLYN